MPFLFRRCFYFLGKVVQIMPCRSSKHPGNKTRPAQQRINQAASVATLSRLLQLNFPDGARLIVLPYAPGGYIPTGVYAEQDIAGWVRSSRKRLGNAFQYVRITGQGHSDPPATVHHVAVPLQLEAAEHLASMWEYGPAQTKKIECGQLATLAAQLMVNARTRPGQHTWAASRGLRRS